MGITERKEREKAERKGLIMRCTKELILERGVERVSMMDIAGRTELSKATLYLYFTSKEELFKAICDEAGNRFVEYVRSRLRPGLSALEALKIYWMSYLDMYGESEDMLIMFNIQHFLAPAFPFIQIEESPESSGYSYAVYDMIKNMVEQGIAEGTFEPDIKPEVASRTFITLFSYIVENAARMPKAGRKSQFIVEEMKNIFGIMLRGLARNGFDRSRLVLPEPERVQNLS
jgi:AcrR family transcriptional regulator